MAFTTSFRSRAEALIHFEEGRGSLTTGGTHSCMEPTNIEYGVPLVDREVGARLSLNNRARCQGAEIAVGHLGTPTFYGFGDFEWRARVHHAPDGSAPPENSFSCLSTYSNSPIHNELAWCFDASEVHEAHLSYWYDANMHRTIVWLEADLTAGLHTFTTVWRPDGIDWLVDQTVVHQVRGTAGNDLPWEPMSVRVILRPVNRPSVFLGPARLDLAHVSYTPAEAVGARTLIRTLTSVQAPPPLVLPGQCCTAGMPPRALPQQSPPQWLPPLVSPPWPSVRTRRFRPHPPRAPSPPQPLTDDLALPTIGWVAALFAEQARPVQLLPPPSAVATVLLLTNPAAKGPAHGAISTIESVIESRAERVDGAAEHARATPTTSSPYNHRPSALDPGADAVRRSFAAASP